MPHVSGLVLQLVLTLSTVHCPAQDLILDYNANTICSNYKWIRKPAEKVTGDTTEPTWPCEMAIRTTEAAFFPSTSLTWCNYELVNHQKKHGTQLPVEDKYVHFGHFHSLSTRHIYWAGTEFIKSRTIPRNDPWDCSRLYKFCLCPQQALMAASLGLLSVEHSLSCLAWVFLFIVQCKVVLFEWKSISNKPHPFTY